jgi:hypothetical protein
MRAQKRAEGGIDQPVPCAKAAMMRVGPLGASRAAHAMSTRGALQNQEKRFAVDDPIPHCAHKCRVTSSAAVACFGIRA